MMAIEFGEGSGVRVLPSMKKKGQNAQKVLTRPDFAANGVFKYRPTSV